tara:strand:+ start:14694 stop:15302 length:609 start_codon:yes stop_codon:yes gene_type:complete
MSPTNFFENCKFLVSGFSLKDLPEDTGSEVAFCGRSNSGKSSLLNCLTKKRKLAKTSKTPGRTQSINIFSLDDYGENRISDLPGYGFAKVSKQTKKSWGKLITDYLNSRRSLVGLVIVMDIRQPFRDSDLTLINWSLQTKTPLLVILNKSDKLSKSKAKEAVTKANQFLDRIEVKSKALSFSSKKNIGLEPLTEELLRWFGV